MSKKLLKSIVFYGAVGIFTIGLIVYFIFSEDGLLDLINSNCSFSGLWISLACILQLTGVFVDALITYAFFHSNYPQVTFWETIKVTMIGQFFCYVTPASTGGQPMQAIYLNRINVDLGYSSGALLQKLLVWQVSCMIYGSSIFIFNFKALKATINTPVMWTFVAIGLLIQVAMVLAILMCSLSTKLTKNISNWFFNILSKIKMIKNVQKKKEETENQIDMFHHSSKQLILNPKLIIKVFILTFIQLTFIYAVPYCLYKSFYLSGKSLVDVISLQAFVNLVSSMIPLPGATGAAELSYDNFFITLFGKYIKPSTILWRVITYYGMILVTAPFVYMFKRKHKNISVKEEV